MDMIAVIAAVMLVFGLFGGWINYHRGLKDDGRSANLVHSLAAGTAAAFLVPLFLNMISSNLLDVIRGTSSSPGDPYKLFVLAGFCLVASISSKAFIDTLSKRILQEAREAREQAENNRRELANVQETIQPIVAKETESDDGSDPGDVAGRAPAMVTFSTAASPEERIMAALVPRRWTLRSLAGISKEAGIDLIESSRILSEFVQSGLAGVRDTNNGPRWFLTERGRRYLQDASVAPKQP